MLNSKLGMAMRATMHNGMAYVRYMFDIVEICKTDRWGNILTDPFTQTRRLWALSELFRMGVGIPWEHVIPEAIDAYLHERDAKEHREAEHLI